MSSLSQPEWSYTKAILKGLIILFFSKNAFYTALQIFKKGAILIIFFALFKKTYLTGAVLILFNTNNFNNNNINKVNDLISLLKQLMANNDFEGFHKNLLIGCLNLLFVVLSKMSTADSQWHAGQSVLGPGLEPVQNW